MSYWAAAECERDQLVLIATTLGDRIPEDHAVRLFWELLATYDWRVWEGCYDGRRGQPPIHPKTVAGVLLYGLTQGIRSSRKLEWACGHAVDFIWLAEGRTIDHSTFCEFRRQFREPLKQLFRHLGRLAQGAGLVRLNCVAIDGTRALSAASRHTTRTAASLERELADLDQKLETMLDEAEAVDAHESQTVFGVDEAPLTRVPRELASAAQRRTRVQNALQQLQARQAAGSNQKKVAVSDPDAPIVPGKTNLVAPHYTPLLAVDTHRQWIVGQEVLGDAPEATGLLPLLDEVAMAHGEPPRQVVADSGFGTPENLAALETHPSDAYVAPSGLRVSSKPETTNPAQRTNLQEPVPAEQWPALPRTSGGKLAMEAFVYDQEQDTYYCPLGRPLPLAKVKTETHRGKEFRRREYLCNDCSGCPLHGECAAPDPRRRVRSHGKSPLRERMTAKITSEAGRAAYARRQQVEPPFARVKHVLKLDRFLQRGIDAVKHEWQWICTACNLKLFLSWLRRTRDRLAKLDGQAVA